MSKAILRLRYWRVDPHAVDAKGNTPLHHCCGNEDVTRILLEKGGDPHRENHYGITPFGMAVKANHLPMIRIMLANGADPNRHGKNEPFPLMSAVSKWDAPMINALLDHGANPNQAVEGGRVPLHVAARLPNHDVVRLLLEKGAEPNRVDEEGKTPLYEAIWRCNSETVQALLDHGADPNQATQEGSPPLFWAISQNHHTMVQALLEKGADPKAWVLMHQEWESLLYFAIRERYSMDIIRSLLTHGANPNHLSLDGNTLLFREILNDDLEAIQLLLTHKADPNLPIQRGQTPLCYAALRGYSEAVKLLLDHGADPRQTNSAQETPLELAVSQDNGEVVLQLLEAGLDPNATSHTGESLLRIAAVKGHVRAIRALLAKGANLNQLSPAEQLLLKGADPAEFLDHFIKIRSQLQPTDLTTLYDNVEYNYPVGFGMKLLPELLAFMPFYARIAPSHRSQATAAITRLYRFTDANVGGNSIRGLAGIAHANWGALGILGLSFSRWKYDTMTMWKGGGPSEKSPLLVQSGLFKPVPARAEDKQYFKSFVHYDPASGLSIELRRAYIVVSKPGLGSLLIRNSSHHFGRDLFPEPAYYHPEKYYTDGEDLLKPGEVKDLEGGYMNVLGKTLNRNEESQLNFHEKIQELLSGFHGVMEQYTQWKCGFRNGRDPAGFRYLLEAALMSSANNGLMTPFGNRKNMRLAWVNPYDLPAPVLTLDLSQPGVLKEAMLYQKILKGQLSMPSTEAYQAQLPNLMAFLSEGSRQGLELILS